jgi:outer membrane protein
MKHLTGLLVSACLLALFSTSSQALDLLQVYTKAEQQDAQLKIALSQLQSIRQNLPLAQSANKPQVNFTANATYQDTTGSRLTGDDTQQILGLGLFLQQNLYNREISAQVAAADAAIQQAEADYEAARQDLIVRVTEAYFAILSARDNVEFAEAEKNAIGRQLEQAKKRFEVGLIAITDVKEAQASFDLSVSQKITALNTLDNAREALQVIIGERLQEPVKPLGEKVDLIVPEPSQGGTWVEQAQKNNLLLVSAQAALRTADENRNIARADRRPTVNLTASYQESAVDSDIRGNFDSDDLSVGVQLDMPLYTGGRTSSSIQQAEANYVTASNNLLLQKRLIAQQTNTAYLAVKSGIGQVNALEQALISTTAALEATEAGFDVGTRTSVDVLNSLRETYRSRRDYASARYDYLTNTLRLKQAAGVLNDSNLQSINDWLTN